MTACWLPAPNVALHRQGDPLQVKVDGPLEQDHFAGNRGVADVLGSLPGRCKREEATAASILL
jgi:hypothetical protein